MFFLCLGFCFFLIPYAQALEIFGLRLFERDETKNQTQDLIDPQLYQLTFKVQNNEALIEPLKAASALWNGRNKATAAKAGVINRAKTDYSRLLAALYKQGYYGGSISIKVAGRDAAQLRPLDPINDNPKITVNIIPGPPYHFSTLTIDNPPPLLSPNNQPSPEFQTGLIAKAGLIQTESRRIIESWRLAGHARAKIVEEKVVADHKARTLRVLLAVDPGEKTTIGAVDVNGAKSVDPALILRQSGLKSGVPYDLKSIEKSKERLNRFEIFSSVRVEEDTLSDEDAPLPITLNVQERKPRRVGVGATISNVDGGGIQAFLLHRNLFGRAESARLSGAISGIGESSELGELDYQTDIDFSRPGIFHPDVNFTSRFTAQRTFNDTFEETSIQNESSFSYFSSDAFTLSAGARVQLGTFEDAFGTRDLLTTGLFSSIILDKRDQKLDPERGIYLDLDLNPFYEFEFQNVGLRLTIEGRTYQTFGEERPVTFAARGRLGSIIGPAREETAPDFLFFTGGGGSIRGFGFKTVGVSEENGDITGGRSFVEGSVEARFRINQSFGGVIFADAGAVSSASTFDFEDDASIGIGLGIRYFTGIGPIRLDIGVPLNGGMDDPPVAVFAGIGQTF